jgi:putative FmdB family regulatory protein
MEGHLFFLNQALCAHKPADRHAMPIYEYKCAACQHELESLQKFSDAPLVTCPACGEDALTKLVSAAGFQLKGSGWYQTDFKGSGAKPAAKADAAKSDSKDAGTAESAKATDGKATDGKAAEAKPAATPAPVAAASTTPTAGA